MSEAARVYQHFREIFGDTRPRPGRARGRVREAAGSEPFTPGRDPRPLADAIDGLTSQLGWTAPLSQHEVLASWAEVAGEETARHSEAIAIDNGVLQVRCESTAWATQLRLMAPTILAKLHAQVGGNVVTRLRVVGPTAPSWKKGPRSVRGRGPRDTYG